MAPNNPGILCDDPDHGPRWEDADVSTVCDGWVYTDHLFLREDTMAKWVQHKSGQGEKWEVLKEYEYHWSVNDPHQHQWFLRLPKSEFIECEGPEEWEDVTGEFEFFITNPNGWVHLGENYRLRKVQLYRCDGDEMCRTSYKEQWAFIVERKKS